MDYVYLVDLNNYIGDDELKTDVCHVALSSRNVLAMSADCCIYIVPLEKPNELIPVHLSSTACVRLCWSDDGVYLLCVYKNGICDVFSVKTTLLNTVVATHSFSINSSQLVVVKSFSKTPKPCLNYQMKESSANYFDKFNYKPFNCLKNFGNFSYNGFLFLTKEAKLHVVLTDTVKTKFEQFEFEMNIGASSTGEVKVKTEMDVTSIANSAETTPQTPSHFDLIDFAFVSDGSINVALTNYEFTSPIFIYKVNLKLSYEGVCIEGSHELIATIQLSNEVNERVVRVTKSALLFTSSAAAQSVCVGLQRELVSGETESVIEFWQPLHVDEMGATVSLMDAADVLSALSGDAWTRTHALTCTSRIASLSVSKCAASFQEISAQTPVEMEVDTADELAKKESTVAKGSGTQRRAPQPVHLVVTYTDGTVGFIDTRTHAQSVTSRVPVKESTGFKHRKYPVEYILAVDQSNSGALAVGITNLCRLTVVRQFAMRSITLETGAKTTLAKGDPSTTETNISSGSITSLLSLYEYCLLTGYDYWDLLVCTNPALIRVLIERLEEWYCSHLATSLQRVFFARHYSLLYSLYRRSSAPVAQCKSLDILAKLTLNRCTSLTCFAVQLVVNTDAMLASVSSGDIPPAKQLTTSAVLASLESASTASTSTGTSSVPPIKNNLHEYFTDCLKLKLDNTNNFNLNDLKANMNDIVDSIVASKSRLVVVNQQLKHVFQWVIDISLYLVSVAAIKPPKQASDTKSNQNTKPAWFLATFGATLLSDLWFLNEIRKALLYIKLLFVCSATPSTNAISTQQSYLMTSSLPTLPLRTSVSIDILSDLFSVFTRIILKTLEGASIYADETLMEQLVEIQTETFVRPMGDTFANLKQPWLVGASWSKTLAMPVDQLFEAEKDTQLYPLFDIMRLIQFSRSTATKQCVRCGNFTESNTTSANKNSPNTNVATSKLSSIFMQDACASKCICGGAWVQASL